MRLLPASDSRTAGPRPRAGPTRRWRADGFMAAQAFIQVMLGKAKARAPEPDAEDSAKTATSADDHHFPSPAEQASAKAEQDAAIEATGGEAHDFLAQARSALLAEGFASTPMQYRKKGQVFGLVKEHGHELQLHARGFANGVIESEVELSNRYIQHLWSPRRSAHAEIETIFKKHNVATDTINTEFRTRTGADRDQLPKLLTRTSDVVKAGMGVAGAVGAVAIARFIQRSSEDKAAKGRGRHK